MKRILTVLAVAALMAVMLVVMAAPAMADPWFDSNDFGNDFGDQELESGSIELAPDISLEGNYSDQDVGLSQFANTGNYANQQGFDWEDDGCWDWCG